ncbi:MAG: hypothetical protein RL660_1043 [Bacteroidota bacterium]
MSISCKTVISLLLIFAYTQLVQAQVFEKGALVTSIGIGTPNGAKVLFGFVQEDYPNAVITQQKAGPLHGKFELGLSRRIGVGLSVNYITSRAIFANAGYDYDLRFASTKLNIRSNLHLGNKKRFDPYIGIGLGYGFGGNNFKTNDPFFKPYDLGNPRLGFEVTLGSRFYFNDNIGIYAELGMARSIVQFGLCYKVTEDDL